MPEDAHGPSRPLVASPLVAPGNPQTHDPPPYTAAAAAAAAAAQGSGSGYLLAALAHLAGPTGRVYGVEHIPALVAASRAALDRALGEGGALRAAVEVVEGDGRLGVPGRPELVFDAIHVCVRVCVRVCVCARARAEGGRAGAGAVRARARPAVLRAIRTPTNQPLTN